MKLSPGLADIDQGLNRHDIPTLNPLSIVFVPPFADRELIESFKANASLRNVKDFVTEICPHYFSDELWKSSYPSDYALRKCLHACVAVAVRVHKVDHPDAVYFTDIASPEFWQMLTGLESPKIVVGPPDTTAHYSALTDRGIQIPASLLKTFMRTAEFVKSKAEHVVTPDQKSNTLQELISINKGQYVVRSNSISN